MQNYATVLESYLIPAEEAASDVAPTLKFWSESEVYFHGPSLKINNNVVNLNDYCWFGDFCRLLKDNRINERHFADILKEHFTEMRGKDGAYVESDEDDRLFNSMNMYRIASDGMGDDLLYSVKTKMFYEYMHDYGDFNPSTAKGTAYKKMINSATTAATKEEN